MKTTNFKIEQEDLKTLYVSIKFSTKLNFNDWVKKECEPNYLDYAKKRETPKTYSQWVNGQIMALNY